ncbi:MAG: hypothetical protein KatS3mg121_0585 [Gammaproteobacteria bacterium]|nr:MAG: hypothetical protein KatS3mg121_0585 [Gammaproteobacteria bacterium]
MSRRRPTRIERLFPEARRLSPAEQEHAYECARRRVMVEDGRALPYFFIVGAGGTVSAIAIAALWLLAPWPTAVLILATAAVVLFEFHLAVRFYLALVKPQLRQELYARLLAPRPPEP